MCRCRYTIYVDFTQKDCLFQQTLCCRLFCLFLILVFFGLKSCGSLICRLVFNILWRMRSPCSTFFTYALRRSERFLGASLTVLTSVSSQLIYGVFPSLQKLGPLYILVLVLVTLICVFQYRDEDLVFPDVSDHSTSQKASPVALMLFFFFAHKAIEIFYTYTQHASSLASLRMNGIFGIAVFSMALFLFFHSRYSLWHMCNLFFLGMLFANLLPLIFQTDTARTISQAFHGFELIGFVASYTMLGDVMSKHADFKRFRKVVIIALNASILIYLIPGFEASLFPEATIYLSLAICLFLFLVFILLTPAYANFFAVLRSSFQTETPTGVGAEMQEVNNDACSFAQQQFQSLMSSRHLTSRETQVVTYLLQGYLYKQCATALGISVETVKFHARNAYKKLGVSGRSELFSFFFEE